MNLRSKLPEVGTTIFSVMSRRAAELDAVNLGQGFPDYEIDPRLGTLVAQAMQQGYTAMEGDLTAPNGPASEVNVFVTKTGP